jgi:glycosyltransferase involved in cell wall biosynthesis
MITKMAETPSPALSAILCTYNRAPLLNLVLDSLTMQTLDKKLYEIIVVDDGSSDETRQVVESYKARLPLYYAYQRNAGLASAKNHAIFLARGEILLFIDDDDVASPKLFEAHLGTHARYTADHFAVLGHTSLDPEIVAKPLMHFVTEIACFLFSYPDLRDGDLLDYTYFWGGRSSCKRRFLINHGVFNPVFRFGCEDIELGYRLFKYGLTVVYNKQAKSMMIRNIGFDDFCNRMIRQGRSNFVFSRLHSSPEIQRWTEIAKAEGLWGKIEPVYDAIIRSARELDRITNLKIASGFGIDNLTEILLHRAYRAAFEASKFKGIMEEKISMKTAEQVK